MTVLYEAVVALLCSSSRINYEVYEIICWREALITGEHNGGVSGW